MKRKIIFLRLKLKYKYIGQTVFWRYNSNMNNESFEKFTNRRKNKQSNFGKKQQNRNKRGNRHAQKQQLNDSVYRKDFD